MEEPSIEELVRTLELEAGYTISAEDDVLRLLNLAQVVVKLAASNPALAQKLMKYVSECETASEVANLVYNSSETLEYAEKQRNDGLPTAMHRLLKDMSTYFTIEELVEILEAGTEYLTTSLDYLLMSLAPVIEDAWGEDDEDYKMDNDEDDEKDAYRDDELVHEEEHWIGDEPEYKAELLNVDEKGNQDVTQWYDDYHRRMDITIKHAKPVEVPLTEDERDAIANYNKFTQGFLMKQVIDYRMYVAYLGNIFPSFQTVLEGPIGTNVGDGVRVLHSFLSALLEQLTTE